MNEYTLGQAWQLVNGKTVIITRINFIDGFCNALGSDMLWRNTNGVAIQDEDEDTLEFNFAKVITDPVVEPSDFMFRLHDSEIEKILASIKSNGLFNVLEFGKQVSLATTRRLKDLT